MARTRKSKGESLLQPWPSVSNVDLESEVRNLRGNRSYVVPPLRWHMDPQGNQYVSETVFNRTYRITFAVSDGPWFLEDNDGKELANGALPDMLLKAEIDLHAAIAKTLVLLRD